MSDEKRSNLGRTKKIQGWQCPVCEIIYAPTVKECPKCIPPKNESVDKLEQQLLLE